jgi:hypothetical protein
MESTAPDRNDEVAAGLEALAALIRQNPAASVNPSYSSHAYQYCADSEDEVTAIAAGLGVTPEWNEGHTHYTASVEAADRFFYRAVYITREHMARYNAANTYDGCVEPAEVTA